MDAIATSAQAHSAFQLNVTAPAAAVAETATQKPASQATAAKGDTATISDDGKALAKGAKESESGEASAPIATTMAKGAAVTPAALAATLQTAQTKQKSLQARLDAAKLDAASNPGGDAKVANLSAQVTAANTAVTKAQIKVYS